MEELFPRTQVTSKPRVEKPQRCCMRGACVLCLDMEEIGMVQ